VAPLHWHGVGVEFDQAVLDGPRWAANAAGSGTACIDLAGLGTNRLSFSSGRMIPMWPGRSFRRGRPPPIRRNRRRPGHCRWRCRANRMLFHFRRAATTPGGRPDPLVVVGRVAAGHSAGSTRTPRTRCSGVKLAVPGHCHRPFPLHQSMRQPFCQSAPGLGRRGSCAAPRLAPFAPPCRRGSESRWPQWRCNQGRGPMQQG